MKSAISFANLELDPPPRHCRRPCSNPCLYILNITVRGHEGEDPDLDPRADTGNELQTANYT